MMKGGGWTIFQILPPQVKILIKKWFCKPIKKDFQSIALILNISAVAITLEIFGQNSQPPHYHPTFPVPLYVPRNFICILEEVFRQKKQ